MSAPPASARLVAAVDAPDGVLEVFADGPTPSSTAAAQRALLDNLRRHGFQVVEAITRRAGASTVAGALATA